MITLETICRLVPGIEVSELRRWVAEEWIRPERSGGEPVFREIDIARVRLILELRREMEVGEAAMPVVLSLLDQLYETRRQLRLLCRTLAETGPEEVQRSLAALLGERRADAPREARADARTAREPPG